MQNMQLCAKYAKYAIKVLIQYIKSSTWPCVLSSWNSLGREVGPDRPPFHPRWTSLRMTAAAAAAAAAAARAARRRRTRATRRRRARAARRRRARAARRRRALAVRRRRREEDYLCSALSLQEGTSEQD